MASSKKMPGYSGSSLLQHRLDQHGKERTRIQQEASNGGRVLELNKWKRNFNLPGLSAELRVGTTLLTTTKATASRFYQLLSHYALIAPFLREI